jgi:hypothetical protein
MIVESNGSCLLSATVMVVVVVMVMAELGDGESEKH